MSEGRPVARAGTPAPAPIMSDRLVWERDGRDWPSRAASRFVPAAGFRWHVQQMGQGPVLLLVHGTGAATHSWRGLAPLLARRFTVVAPDLPGHGFTEPPPGGGLSLPGMAGALGALLEALGARPALAAGHSAGAAILARMSLDRLIAPAGLVSLNGALLPLSGLPGTLFAPLAKLLAATSLMSRLFAWRAADRAVIERMLKDTGSTLEPAGVELYGRLARNPGHVGAALGMMASWELRELERDLPRLEPRLLLVVGGNDRTIPPAHALRVKRLVPGAALVTLAGLGHLAHEERPEAVAELVVGFACDTGVLPQR
jgi:magnesium chelatase accessory protein